MARAFPLGERLSPLGGTESDPAKAAKLKTRGDRCEMLTPAAHRREVEAEEAKKAKRAKARKKR
jgi:hypothetical protein